MFLLLYQLECRNQSMPVSVCPRGNFTAFVEWVLVNNRSAFTIGPTDYITCPTPGSEPSLPPHCTERTPEPTADSEPEPAPMHRPVKRTEQTIAPEPEPHGESDQMLKPATLCVAVGQLMEFKGSEWSPTHTSTTEGEQQLDSALLFQDLEENNPVKILRRESGGSGGVSGNGKGQDTRGDGGGRNQGGDDVGGSQDQE